MIEYLALTVGGQTVTSPQTLPRPGTEASIISNALTLFMTAGIIITILVAIWAGIQWVTSGGEKEKIASAKARLTWAIIGLIIIFISFFIISAFNYFFNVNLWQFSTQ